MNISPHRPYPFDADIRAGSTRITAEGNVTKPFDLGRFEVQLTVSGADLNRLHDLTGLTLPNTPLLQGLRPPGAQGRPLRLQSCRAGSATATSAATCSC
ncbi:hypothetical protein ACRAWD_13305 [Caulobacter segnis]